MNTPSPRNFFALVEDFDVRLLSMTEKLQKELTQLFNKQRDDFFAEYPDKMAFEADYSPAEGESQFIDGFTIPANLQEALETPLIVNPLTGQDLHNVRGLFTGDPNGQEILFQIFDRRRLLSTCHRSS